MKSFLLIITLLFTTSIYSQETSQAVMNCKPLESLINKINNKKRYNYSSVNKIYNLSRTSKCDGGTYGSGMTQIIVQSLILDFVRTVKVAGKNKNTETFVVAHVNSSSESQDLEKVLKNANEICPREKKEACRRIAIAAKGSMN